MSSPPEIEMLSQQLEPTEATLAEDLSHTVDDGSISNGTQDMLDHTATACSDGKSEHARRSISVDTTWSESTTKTSSSREESPASSPAKSHTSNSLLLKSAQFAQRVPVTVTVSRLSYHVPTSPRGLWPRVRAKFKRIANEPSLASPATQTTKTVLHPLSLTIHPGEILAIMGPSGSGKTSLLNLLAGRTRQGTVDGCVMYNGVVTQKCMNGKVFGYVLQHDALQANLTVSETLDYALELRTGTAYSREQRQQRVQEVIEELGLSHCADTMIGGNLCRGVSGGELKRVAIGVELLSQPSVLYLDEPTSGLDSKAASNLVETLVALAHRGRTIVCTVHQPQSRIFTMFDKVLLLSQGRPMYMGPASDAVAYFTAAGHPCPPFSNPSDFFLDILALDTRGADAKVKSMQRINCLQQEYQNSPLREKNELEVAEWAPSTTVAEAEKPAFDFTRYLPGAKDGAHVNWLVKMSVLLRRNFKESRRNNIVTISRMVQTVVLGLFIGFLYWDMGHGQESIRNRRGALFCLAIQQGLCGFLSIITAFQTEKLVYFREHDAGLYGTFAYFMARLIVEVPITLISPAIFVAISYPLLHLQADAVKFVLVNLSILVSSMAAQALGLVVGTVTPSHEVANVVAPIFLGFITIFGGLLIDKGTVPAVLKWIPQVNFVAYGYEMLSKIEFDGLVFTCSDEERKKSVNGTCPISTGQEALEQMSMGDVDLGHDFGYLLALTAVFLVVAYACLKSELNRR